MAQKKSLMQKAIEAAKKVVAKPVAPKKAGGLKEFNSYKPKANESYMSLPINLQMTKDP